MQIGFQIFILLLSITKIKYKEKKKMEVRGLGGGMSSLPVPSSWQFTISRSSGKITKEGTVSELKSVESLFSTLGYNAVSENRMWAMKVVPVSSVPLHNYSSQQ